MKKIICCIVLISSIIFLFAACSSDTDHVGEAQTPSGSSVMKGRDYKAVVAIFEGNGFTNIKLDPIDDLIFGWLKKEGEVEEVSVGGNFDYSPDKWVPANTEVVIRYHVFPKEETNEPPKNNPETNESNVTTAPKPETEAEHTTAPQPDNNTETTTAPLPNNGTEQTTESTMENEILTVENCAELANILSLKTENDYTYVDFAKKYKGKIIQFDGRIDYIVNHGNYTTRYDILVSAGDYDPDTQTGPTFKFKDVNTTDLGLNTLFLEEEIAIGDNVLITAKVVSYNYDTGIFLLDPISVVDR